MAKFTGLTRYPFLKVTLLAMIVALVLSFLFSAGLYSNLELALSDNLYGGGKPLNALVIVAIDDKSIQEIGRWPWDREVFATTLPRLNQSKAIAFDIAFFEPQSDEIDAKLAEAIRQAGNVVLPVEYTAFDSENGKVIGKDIIQTIPEIAQHGTGFGYINVITDHDGKTRAINANVIGDHGSFAYAVYTKYWNIPIGNEIDMTGNRLLINYVGPPGTFKRYSFIDVMKGNIPASEFKDKLVLIGVTSPDLHDEALIPNSAKPMPGVEIHANAVQTMINRDFLYKESDFLVILTIFLMAIATALIFYFVPVVISPFAALALIFAYLFFTILIFNQGLILNIIYVPITVVISYLASLLYYYVSEKKQRKKVLGAFEKYVSKEVIKDILDNPEKLKLGGERREITVFFSDIRGFTTISEKLKPEDLVNLLNEYLTEMTEIVLSNKGVVDKYMGDAIMAFWGAPLDQPKHAELACKTSLEMEKRLKELQKKWGAEGVPPLEIGIGLNSGPAVVGNMGSINRFDYTAMGDTVNLGSRLEGLNKPYGTRVIISESTKKLIEKRPFLVRKLDAVKVKGKNQPIFIYELVSKQGDALDWYPKVITHFEKGLELYFKQRWDAAIKEFQEALKYREDDMPSKTFIERCKAFKKDPPGKDWDGVCVMKTK